MKALLILVSGESHELTPRNGKSFTAQELGNMVRGFFELVRLPNGNILVLNEDGLELNLPTNDVATVRYHYIRTGPRGIVGNVLECPPELLGDTE